jgi:hypothetical protein
VLHYIKLERLARDKHSDFIGLIDKLERNSVLEGLDFVFNSLLFYVILRTKRKSFYNSERCKERRAQCYKTFLVRSLRIFVISQSF